MTLKSDLKPAALRSLDCDRSDLFRLAVATGFPSDLSLEWMLDRVSRPQIQSEVRS